MAEARRRTAARADQTARQGRTAQSFQRTPQRPARTWQMHSATNCKRARRSVCRSDTATWRLAKRGSRSAARRRFRFPEPAPRQPPPKRAPQHYPQFRARISSHKISAAPAPRNPEPSRTDRRAETTHNARARFARAHRIRNAERAARRVRRAALARINRVAPASRVRPADPNARRPSQGR